MVIMQDILHKKKSKNFYQSNLKITKIKIYKIITRTFTWC